MNRRLSVLAWVVGAAALVVVLAGNPAMAGEPACAAGPPTVAAVAKAATAARRLERALEETGADIVVVGRVGSDLGRHGIVYTHAGMAWRDDPAARWQVTHLLNDCGGPSSRLYRQGLVNFFLDDPLRHDALMLVPDEATRRMLAARLRRGTSSALHRPVYSALAYPFRDAYQNSNQFVLENLALARLGMLNGGRDAAIAALRDSRFGPHVVRLSATERLGGSFRANVRFDDHPAAEDSARAYSVVTVEAIERWMTATGILAARRELR